MAQEHIDYIKKVLDSWEEFCKSHRLLAESMRELVKDAELLQIIREYLKEKTDHE